MWSAAQQLGMSQLQRDDFKAMLLEKLDERGLSSIDNTQIRIDAEHVHVDPIAADAFGNVIGIMPAGILHWWAVDHVPLLQDGWQRFGVETSWITKNQTGAQSHQSRVDVAAEINISEKVDPVSITQYSLQPVTTYFVAGGAHEIDQVLA